MWLRSDFSLAITGFVCADAPEIEEESKRDELLQERKDRGELSQPQGSHPYVPSMELSEGDGQYRCFPWSEGELIFDGSVGDDSWTGEWVHGCVVEDL